MSLIGLLTSTEKQMHSSYTGDPYCGISKTTGGFQRHLKKSSPFQNHSTHIWNGGWRKAMYFKPSSRSTITPTTPCSADLYRHTKRRVGRSLKQVHYKGRLVPSRRHKLSGTKGGHSDPKSSKTSAQTILSA